MAAHSKIRDTLSEAERAEFEAYLRGSPQPTVVEGVEWLAARGFKVSRNAVWNHRKGFEERLQAVRERSEMAAAFGAAAREGGAEAVAESTILQLQQKLFDVAMAEDGEELSPKDWADLTAAAKNLVGSNAANKKLQRELAEQKAKQAEFEKSLTDQAKTKKVVTAEDIAAARKAVFGG